MKVKLILLFLIYNFSIGCNKNTSYTKNVTFNITNSSSNMIREVDIKIVRGVERINAISLTNLDINKKEIRVTNLSSFNIKGGDASYIALVTLSDDRRLEKEFGYITNGVEFRKEPYNIDISNSEIIMK